MRLRRVESVHPVNPTPAPLPARSLNWNAGAGSIATLRRPSPRNHAAGFLAAVMLFAGIAARGAESAASAADCAAWNEVERFRGYYTCTRVHTQSSTSGSEAVSGESTLAAAATFTLALAPNSKWTWRVAQGDIAGSFDAHASTTRVFYSGTTDRHGSYSGPVNDLTLSLDVKRCHWSFQAQGRLPQPFSYTVHTVSVHRDDPGQNVDRTETVQSTDYPQAGIDGALPHDHVGPVRGTWDRTVGKVATGLDEYHASVLLVPEYKDVTLVVELEGETAEGKGVSYEKWLPRGTLLGTAGSALKVKAQLQSSDGSATKVRARHFTFQLHETSHEPGICMNFPLPAAADADFKTADLKFTPPGAKDAERQEVELPPLGDRPGYPSATTEIECLDYGAWSDLTVTCALEDGRTITGHLKNDASMIVIPLPKRTAGSHIADAWKADHGIAADTPDDDDSEKLPAGGKAPGDGFTLYEEYRGFVENDEYIEGDPTKIDFFVNNHIGADAVPGIELFADITGAAVHFRLSDSEFNPDQRVVNGNHRAGAHRVDQHGVVLYTDPRQDGAEAHFSQAGVRGRPKICIGIAVQPRGAATSVTTSENVPVTDLVFAYDRAILHELLHAVGVEHHGKGDGIAMFSFVFADDPRNKTGKPCFWFGSSSDRHITKVIDESTGRDYAEELAPAFEQSRARTREQIWNQLLANQKKFRDARESYTWEFTFGQDVLIELDNLFGHTPWYVGAEHGESSGAEDCCMRYYFADAFRKKGADNTFYFITAKRSEHIGVEVCRSSAGTGINAAGRKPQPRYGDAHAGCGDCADWIVFNDAVPPDPEPSWE